MSDYSDALLEGVPEAPERVEGDPYADLPKEFAEFLRLIDVSVWSDEMRTFLVMTTFALDEGQLLAECTEEIDALMALDPTSALRKIDELVEGFFGTRLRDYMEKVLFADGTQSSADYNLERAEKIGKSDGMRGLKIGAEAYNAWYRLVSAMSSLKYSLVAKYVKESSEALKDMHEVSRVEYKFFPEIGRATNDFYASWVSDCGSLLSTEERQERGFTNELAAIRKTDAGEFCEVPWCDAYPKEIARLVAVYRSLAGALNDRLDPDLNPDGECYSNADRTAFKAKAAYYNALADAFESSTIEAFLRADTLLPGQSCGRGDLSLHIHTIERGYGADEVQRLPEVSIRFPDAEGREVNETALRTRADMVRELRKFLEEGDFSDETRSTVDLVEITTYLVTHFLGGGMELDFIPAGQILPNEVDCRVKGGVSVTVNRKSMHERMPLYHDALEAVLGKDVADEIFPRGKIDVDKMMGRSIASHEYGHAIGLTRSTFDRLGKQFIGTYAEEWKATVGGMVLAEWQTFLCEDPKNEVTMNDLRESLVEHIAAACRYTAMRKAEHAVPYLRKSLMLMKVMEEEGVLLQLDGVWGVDLDDTKVVRVYLRLEEQYRRMIEIYDSGSREDLEAFMRENLRPSDFTRAMFAGVDGAFEGQLTEAPGLEEVCELPAR